MDSERKMLNHWVFGCFLCLLASWVTANVVLMGNNLTLAFDDIEANFGESYILHTVFGLALIDCMKVTEPKLKLIEILIQLIQSRKNLHRCDAVCLILIWNLKLARRNSFV